jgi:hypothetical protein
VLCAPVTLHNLQVLERSSWDIDLLFILVFQRVGNRNCCWGFFWCGHCHFSFIMKGISIIVKDNSELKEGSKILLMHEEITQANNGSLMLISCKITKLDHASAIQSVNINYP